MIWDKYLSKRRARRLIGSGNRERDGRRWAKAAEWYGQALALTPERADIWVQYGHMLKESGDRSGASRAYARAVSMEPACADTHLQIGHLHKLEGDLDAAVSSYARALECDHGLTDAAEELKRLGRPEEVERVLTRPTSESQRTPTQSDRLEALEARMGAVGSQISTFLEHVSTTKALAFHVARLEAAVLANAKRIDDVAAMLADAEAQGARRRADVDALDRGVNRQAEALAAIAAQQEQLALDRAAGDTDLARQQAELNRLDAALTALAPQVERQERTLLRAVQRTVQQAAELRQVGAGVENRVSALTDLHRRQTAAVARLEARVAGRNDKAAKAGRDDQNDA